MEPEFNAPVNYHAYLDDVKGKLDPVISKMRVQNGKPWRKTAWFSPVTLIIANAKHFKIISSIKWASLPVIGPIIAGFAAGKYSHFPLWSIILGCILLSTAAYYGIVKWYIGKMSVIGSPEFHVEVYKQKRPADYAFWAHLVEKPDFTFNGLARIFDILITRTDASGHIDRLIGYSENQERILRESMETLLQKSKDQGEAIEYLEGELRTSDQTVTYLVGLIKKINENLYRLINGKLQLHDLDFVTGFSLYRIVDRTLELIADKGTTGASPDRLSLDSSTARKYAAVHAALNDDAEARLNKCPPYSSGGLFCIYPTRSGTIHTTLTRRRS
ncbi:hypothetical protein [Paenibacillus kobensis]|uniref:hypothetical protein n=1 Tax=Paenibacillus kobensis TaxID=59841 RepID=UPI000FDACF1C|nr:hypothetical protein [Paenibacillus kobensis]